MDDNLVTKAIQIAKENRDSFCVTLLQQKLKVGNITCAKLIDVLENRRIIEAYNPNKNVRRVLI
ncbi:DNA translocase FtsK [Clostridium magnum]|uniref:Ftsk gamma domain protein n=1 Tax=Clostridium magnum DSM 2767 TaxID=1121326 RepID=A0A161X4C4_9CLOT|nr:DNA translocase FtsK [Clostridium magnum]KZL88726.1 ftsk gamma domain protein [Clostridium magnum DSM 2767]SHJ66017.1 Ftsk gamma domain-containing protein [Clostridium magnum DSM 2767]